MLESAYQQSKPFHLSYIPKNFVEEQRNIKTVIVSTESTVSAVFLFAFKNWAFVIVKYVNQIRLPVSKYVAFGWIPIDTDNQSGLKHNIYSI